jgi:hypothetical protein
MRTKGFLGVMAFFAVVLFSYGSANAQDTEPVKDTASKAKDVTVGTATKTKVFVTDNLQTAADKTKDAAKVAAKTTKTFGNNAVHVTENVVGQTYEGGKWFMVSTWDGTKWVAKRTWYPNKK